MGKWVTIITLFIALGTVSAEAASGNMQELIAHKRAMAAAAKYNSEHKIETLRNSKGKSNIINTEPSYSLEDLEPASGNKEETKTAPAGEKPSDMGKKDTGTVDKNINNAEPVKTINIPHPQ